MSREEKNIIGYTIALITEFSNRNGIHQRQAYAYLKRFKGLNHLQQHYTMLHTLSFSDTIDALTEVCAHHGGGINYRNNNSQINESTDSNPER